MFSEPFFKMGPKDDDVPLLRLSEFRFWYQAIKKDNKEVLSRSLETTDQDIQQKLLNGNFDFGETSMESDQNFMTKSCPVWHLVVAFGSQETIQFFISKGVNVFVRSEIKYNVIHNIILTAAFEPQCEDVMIEKFKFIMKNIKEEDKIKLLFAENNNGMRPVEMAMELSATGLFQG